ncbi:bifunctional prephenate dehydrogenase/3-phosphoshikimate 1-carboxyvinyltransferase [Larsenimonas rhizosphaerae]|uniref:3-phosphoshikimate 1-carboxyvinyltransferase n=1 Tax=Larsenimonas rhizosphaerae TaxID=2944682 RepID=A0AA41ZE98_9GAMM|nr:bifunctional prephenate dehydrogenase/3-phosphoshikimate 1-carboxyvinyltransferase [Larsenimonas rhizosphaerae]MCX2523712.1 bifunctional prephenate dehydrogenase/3-phosphoshikimate 1-carboxyvinyltransferase [Larsenimonas rhizosphaerae]
MTAFVPASALDRETVLVIGLGLMGASVAAGLKAVGFGGRVLASDRREADIQTGLSMGIIDGSGPLDELIPQATLVVIAVPVLAIESVLEAMAPLWRDDLVVTDVGSTKQAVRQSVARVFGYIPPNMILGHPIAGSERSGVTAAQAGLFERHKVIVTPEADSCRSALARVHALWQRLGADVLEMGVERHDDVLARTSHLPHLLAFSLVDTLARQDERLDIFRYAAGGFRDFTRIAGSDPVMWRDVFRANKTAVLGALDEFEQGVSRLRQAIEADDDDAMLGAFSRASHARHYFETLLNQASYQSMEQRNITYRASAGGHVQGRIRVPGDKSMSHRSIMLGALADGVTEVDGFLEGEDSLATLQAFREMGVVIEGPHDGRVVIHGVGMHGLQAPAGALYVGNSGTAMRLFAGLLAGQAFDTELTGDASLTRRPMGRVVDPLRLMGAHIEASEGDRPPLRIKGGQVLQRLDYDLPMASAQVKSCILLAGMYAEGETRVREPAPTRDHTERMLNGFGYPVERSGNEARLAGGGRMTGGPIDVPADISSAAFFLVAASITPGADLVLEHVGVNPTRTGVIAILQAMGADLRLENEREVGGEPVADIHVRYAPLKGVDIDPNQVPLAIDEFPVLFIAAANAEGKTRLRGAEELRVKESDRIQAMADGMAVLGIEHTVLEDGIDIVGGQYGGGTVDSLGDHRIAMAFSVAALCASEAITIQDCANVATSFPDFLSLSASIGMRVQAEEA